MIDFLKYRFATLLFSLALIGSFVFVGFQRYSKTGSVFILSVEFTGGTQLLLNFDKTVSPEIIKDIVEQAGWHGAHVRDLSDNNILVRVADFSADVEGLAQRILEKVQITLPDSGATLRQTERIGQGVGQELWFWALMSILIALTLMLGYIAFRFRSFAYAAGAVIALFHDAIIMLAVFLFFNREISLNVVGAILTVIGYSINDTIVIFSRIRDTMAKSRNASLAEMVNISINHTLKRTLLTSISTFLPVCAMLAIGGEALRDFSLALLVGIIFGTYSSVYIASPVMMAFHPLGRKTKKISA